MGGGFNWWVISLWEVSPILVVARIVWVIGSIVLHELGHGIAALRCGDPTPRETGHMTFNPVVHMGTTSLIAFLLIGIAWGQMPVNPSRFRGRHDEAYVAFAGPFVNLSLAFFALILYCLWVAIAGGWWFHSVSVSDPTFGNTLMFLRQGIILNIVLFVFNLVPIPPLDGWRILSTFSRSFREMWHTENAQGGALIAFMVLFYFGSRYIWEFGYAVGNAAIDRGIALVAPAANRHP